MTIDTDAKDDTSDVRTHTSCDGWDALRAEATHAPPTVTLTPDRALSMVAEVRRLRAIETLAREALAELDAQPELAHPDAVWYTGAALRDALEADRG